MVAEKYCFAKSKIISKCKIDKPLSDNLYIYKYIYLCVYIHLVCRRFQLLLLYSLKFLQENLEPYLFYDFSKI